MDILATRQPALELAKTISFAPVLLGFVIGSLPVLIPMFLYRALTGKISCPRPRWRHTIHPCPEA